MSYRNYAPSNGFIVDQYGNGDFTTINAASAAATSGQNIYINPGVYTEDVALTPGVSYFGANFSVISGDGSIPDGPVVIVGKCSLSSAGTVIMTGITLKTNSDYAVSVTGTAKSLVNLSNCSILGTNHGALIHSSTGGGGINLLYCNGNQNTTDTFFALSGVGGASGLFNCFLVNNGSSTNFITVSNTGLNIKFTESFGNLVYSGTAVGTIEHCDFELGGLNASHVLSGTSIMLWNFVRSNSGTATCISVGAGCYAYVTECSLSSSASRLISGSGALYYADIVCLGPATTLDPSLTVTHLTVL